MFSTFRISTVNAGLLLVSMIVAFALLEAGYRVHRYHEFKVGNFALDIVAGPAYYATGVQKIGFGPYAPNQNLVWRKVDVSGDPVLESSFRHNNFGWRSNFDYSREKPDGTYRIAVLGDSFVASHLSTEFWVEKFHNLLEPAIRKAHPDIKRFEVYPFGADGASLGYAAGIYCGSVKAFQPDLVVVNFITDALVRRHQVLPCDQIVAQIEAKTAIQDKPVVNLSNDVVLQLNCSSKPWHPRNRDCKPSNVVFAKDTSLALDREKVREVRVNIGLTLARPHTIYARHSLVIEAAWYLLVTRALAAENSGIQSDAEHAVEALEQIASAGLPVILLHAPTETDIDHGRRIGKEFRRSIDEIEGVQYVPSRDMVVDMAQDEGIDEGQLSSLMFNLPHDGHFSDEGSLLYGRAVSKLLLPIVMEHLSQKP